MPFIDGTPCTSVTRSLSAREWQSSIKLFVSKGETSFRVTSDIGAKIKTVSEAISIREVVTTGFANNRKTQPWMANEMDDINYLNPVLA